MELRAEVNEEPLRDGDGVRCGSRRDEQNKRHSRKTDHGRNGAHPPESPERESGDDPGRDPGDRHPQERLCRTPGKLLQRECSGQGGTDGQSRDRPQPVEEPDPRGDGQYGDNTCNHNAQCPHGGDYR